MWANQNPSDSMTFDIGVLAPEFRLSRHFTLGEARSKDGATNVLVHPAVINLVQYLRDRYGRLRVNSWYRTPQHNESIGGSPMSKHLLGMAVDVYPLEADLEYVKRDVLELPIGGIGIYGSFVHIDVYGANRRWQGE